MSFRAVHAGSGYQYLLRSVATNDAHDPMVEEGKLSNYYQAKGTPPGRWIGRGLTSLRSQTAASGVPIEADQMEALYGLGYHPDTHEMLKAGKKLDECRLGGKFPVYTNDIPVLNELRDAERRFITDNARLPTEDERTELALSIGRPHYVEATGWATAPDKDVIDWVNQQRDEVKQAVAGFDLTFSPAKSISVLWALADRDTANAIAACHHEAVAEVLEWAEENTVRTRMGAGGLAQVKTGGIIASEFTHFDTRAGDPDLHSHVLVSNKVQGPDGKWRTLDSRAMFKYHQTLSARYDAIVQELLTRKMGLSFTPSSRDQGKEPVWEVAGVPQQLIDLFSKRRAMARPVYDSLVADYVARYGRQPDKRTQLSLWQSAILHTRDAKKPAESLDDLRTSWRADVDQIDNADELLSQLDSVLGGGQVDQRPAFYDRDLVDEEVLDHRCREVIDRMVQKRSFFSDHHVTAAVGSYLKAFCFDGQHQAQRAVDELTKRITTHHFVELTPTTVMELPAKLRDESGDAVDRHLGYRKYTTPEILAQEDKVLSAVAEPVTVFSSTEEITDAIESFEKDNGFSLNDGQKALAAHLLQSGTLVGCGVGPAGTGKTTAMQIVANVVRNSGQKVIGLAPSAAAAQVLGNELGIDANTIDSLSFIWRGRHPDKLAGDLSALPIQINPGDVMLVDEAGMVTTDNLAALTEIAQESGAVVRLIGDPHQLDVVGTGGLFDTMCRYSDAVELTEVMRFSHGNDTDQADASLGIRRGDTDALGFYQKRGWVRGGTREQMLVDAVDAYLADVDQGRKSLIVATKNADVSTLNEMIRARYINNGIVDTSREVRLAQSETAGLGDVIIARQNERLANPRDPHAPGRKIINGQLFRVLGVNEDGSATAGDLATGEVFDLPAEYVSEHTHLGYAATVHRAQGATVDTTHAVVDSATSRAGLYVALTRGKHENHLYAVTDDSLDELAEASHEHSSGNTAGLTAEDVLERAVARDGRQKSATDIREEAEEYAGSRERLEKLYRYALDLACADFTDRQLEAWWDKLDADALDCLTEDGRSAVRVAWRDALKADVDPRLLMPAAIFNLAGAHETGAVIAWRLRNHLDEAGATRGEVGSPPPLTRGADRDLHDWLSQTYRTLTEWDQEATENDAHEQAVNLPTASQPRDGELTSTDDQVTHLRAQLDALEADITQAVAERDTADKDVSLAKSQRWDAQRTAESRGALAKVRFKAHDNERLELLDAQVATLQARQAEATDRVKSLVEDKQQIQQQLEEATSQQRAAHRPAATAHTVDPSHDPAEPHAAQLASQLGGSTAVEDRSPQERLAAQRGRQRSASPGPADQGQLQPHTSASEPEL